MKEKNFLLDNNLLYLVNSGGTGGAAVGGAAVGGAAVGGAAVGIAAGVVGIATEVAVVAAVAIDTDGDGDGVGDNAAALPNDARGIKIEKTIEYYTHKTVDTTPKYVKKVIKN